MPQALFENWDVTKGVLTDGLEGNKKAVMESSKIQSSIQLSKAVPQWQATLQL